MGDYANPEPLTYATELVVGDVPERGAKKEEPKPTVTVDKDGIITIR